MIKNHESFSYKLDASVPAFSVGDVFTVMDAQCAICARGATWIARNDQKREFTIIPLQSELGGALMRHYGMDPLNPASWLYVEDGRAYTSLEATIRVGKRLGGIWRLLFLLNFFPRSLQDRLYRFVAENRIAFFGRAELCELPDPEVRKRLLL